MSSNMASSDVIDDLHDMHRGLHIAMESLISAKDFSRAELVLRQLDERLSNLINQVRPIS